MRPESFGESLLSSPHQRQLFSSRKLPLPIRLLFFTDNFPPEANAPASRTFDHCQEWVRQGIEVTVITCAPNFPLGKVYRGYKNKLWQKEEVEGITVIRVWSYMVVNKGIIRRVLDYISYAVMAFFASLFVKTDLIVATSPQFFTAIAGYTAGLIKRKPWIMEVRDLWPESIVAVNAIPGQGRLIRYLERLELFLYRRAAAVVVVTNAFKKNLLARGVPDAKIAVVTNGVLCEKFSVRPKDQELLRRLELRDKFIVGYMGTHGMAHKLDFIVDAARFAPDNIHFLFIGGGAMKNELEIQVRHNRSRNISMLPPVPKSEMARYISLIDIALVPLRRSDTFKSVIPSKIFENAAMDKPILLGVEGESKDILEKYGAGLCFIPEDREDFLLQLEKFSSDHKLYAICQQRCKHLAAAYDRNALAREMSVVFRRVVEKEVPVVEGSQALDS